MFTYSDFCLILAVVSNTREFLVVSSQHFIEPEGLLPRSQVPSTSRYSKPHQSNPYHPISKIHFNIIHPPTSWPSEWSLSFWLSDQYPICTPLLPHSCCMPCPLTFYLVFQWWKHIQKIFNVDWCFSDNPVCLNSKECTYSYLGMIEG
jgi:hypothetical protein